jgi:S-adenosylmethionine hydrolase
MLWAMSPRPIAFISDYGHRDPFAGICRAVIAGIDPEIAVVDITHGVPAHDIRAGAVAAADVTPFLPKRAVLLVIVDPGVGGERRAVAAETADGVALVGPDNGVLWLAAERLGGVAELADVGASEARLRPTSSTFHGRDVFAPVAARLACGDALAGLGETIAADRLTPLPLPAATIGEGRVDAAVLDIDSFGNVRLCTDAAVLGQIGVSPGDRLEVECNGTWMPAMAGTTFSEVPAGELVVYADSTGALAIAANGSSAARLLCADPASRVVVLRR